MIEWINITQDGTYPLSRTRLRRTKSTIYIDGDNPKGTFNFGILDKNGKFVKCPNGNSDVSFVAHHGGGVKMVLHVKGYMGKHSRVGYLASKRKKVLSIVLGIVGPVATFFIDTIIDKITKKF